MPVIIFSTLTPAGCETALHALDLGAIDVMHKPELDVVSKLQEAIMQLTDKIIAGYCLAIFIVLSLESESI